MSFEETNRIIKLIKSAIKEDRSRKEAFNAFKEAGIITEKGNLKSPYKEIYIPVKK
jgi:hypothetical protein